MAKAEFKETLSVDSKRLLEVIDRYEDYPQFVDGCKKIEVVRSKPGLASDECLVTYHINILKDVVYTQRMKRVTMSEGGEVSWVLEGQNEFFTVSNGGWEIRSQGAGKSSVRYWLEIEFKFPVPGFILSGLMKNQLKANVRAFVERAGGSF